MPASMSSSSGNINNNDSWGVVATQQYESGPPASKMQLTSLDDGEVYETVKEEEFIKRKKTTTTTTKNIETRTQRQLVLEDGEIVEDSGPVVTKDEVEDTVTDEVNADEHLTPEGQEGGAYEPPGEGWIPVGGAVVINEKKEKIVKSHQVAENRREEEETQHLGDITNQEVGEHITGGNSDIRALTEARTARGLQVATPQRRLVHESAKKWGTIDTEDVHETSRIQDGHVVTETERTTQREEYDNVSKSDSGSSLSDGSIHEEKRETSHNIVHTKDEDLVEYYAVPRGGTLAQGVKLGEGMHVVNEDFHEDREGDPLDSLSERRARLKGSGTKRIGAGISTTVPQRTDALTSQPLDYQQEEETRKSETNRWLEHHFGSESGRSRGSSEELQDTHSSAITGGGNLITIRMSPRPATPPDEDEVDNMVPTTKSPLRSWNSTSQIRITPAPPPAPAPPAEGAFRPRNNSWAPQTIAEKATILRGTPRSTPRATPPPPVTPPEDHITENMISQAKARLRSTGRILTDDTDTTPPYTPRESHSTPRGYSTQPDKEQVLPSVFTPVTSPPLSPISRPDGSSSSPHPSLDDPVYASRFGSGVPSLLTSRLYSTPNKGSHHTQQSPPDSPPPPLPSTPPPYNINKSNNNSSSSVGRSQSFNVSTRTFINNNNNRLSSGATTPTRASQVRMKEARSVEALDAIDSSSGSRRVRNWPRERTPSPVDNDLREPSPPPRHKSTNVRNHPLAATSFNTHKNVVNSYSNNNSSYQNTSFNKYNGHSSSLSKSYNNSYSPQQHYNTAPTRSDRKKRASKEESNTTFNTIARETTAGTQTTPVPPPRTKRRNRTHSEKSSNYEKSSNSSSMDKPRTSYYFGQESPSTNPPAKPQRSASTLESTSTSRYKKSSPKVERRFKITKTITPVVVSGSTGVNGGSSSHLEKSRNRSWHRSMDVLSTSKNDSNDDSSPSNTAAPSPPPAWTQTLNNRRRPKKYENDSNNSYEAQTLPKKASTTSNSRLSTNSSYYFGGARNDYNGPSTAKLRQGSISSSAGYGGSMQNVSLGKLSSPPQRDSENEERQSVRSGGSSSRPVARSHSLNVKPLSLATMGTNSSLFSSASLNKQEKSSSRYKSSPYLNLRSPNLISTIARTSSMRAAENGRQSNGGDENVPPSPRYSRLNGSTDRFNGSTDRFNGSTDRLNNNGGKVVEEKKERFMKGLLTQAPELFHYLHGDEKEEKNGGQKNPPDEIDSPPQLIRPPESSPRSPATTTQPRIFTFGRGETGSLRRNTSFHQDNSLNNDNSTQLNSDSSSRLNQHRESINSITSLNNHRNSIISNSGTNSLNRSRFNMRTPGSSLLYNNSFRQRSDSVSENKPPWERRSTIDSNDITIIKDARGDDSPAIRDGVVHIPVKYVNSR